MTGAERQRYAKEKREELKTTIEQHFKEKEKEFDEGIKGRKPGQLLEAM